MRTFLSPLFLALTAAVTEAQSFRVSDELPRPTRNRVGGVTLDPTGERAVFAIRSALLERLFVRPTDGSAAARELHLVSGDLQDDLAFDPAGVRLAYRVTVSGVHHLRILRPEPFVPSIRLDASAPFSPGVSSFRFTSDGTQLVFLADPVAEVPRNDHLELYVVPVDGSAAPRLVGPVADPAGDVLDFQLSPDSTRALYRVQSAGTVALFSVRLDGSAPPVRLDAVRPLASVESDYRLSHDGLGVVYRQDRDADDQFELYVTRLDGSQAPMERNAPLVAGGDVTGFALATDDQTLLYRADAAQDERFELHVVGTFVGTPTRLSDTLASGGDVLDFQLDAAGRAALYRADALVDGEERLFTRPLDLSTPTVALASQLASGADVLDFVPAGTDALYRTAQGLHVAALDGLTPALDLGVGGPVEAGYGLDRAGTGVVFARRVQGRLQPFAAPLDASRTPAPIGGTTSRSNARLDFFPAAHGRTLYRAADGYEATETLEPALELWSTRLDGSGRVIRMNRALEEGSPSGQVLAYQLTSDGQSVVYLAQQGGQYQLMAKSVLGLRATRLHPDAPFSDWRTDFQLTATGRVVYVVDDELYSSRLDGSELGVRLHPPLNSLQEVDEFRVTEDGAWVVYTSDALTTDQVELFRAPVDGSASPVRLGHALAPGEEVTRLELDPSGTTAVYQSTLDSTHALWSVPVDGSVPAVRLDLAAVPGGNSVFGTHFQLTPDGQTVLFVSDATIDEQFELYRVPIDGSAAPVILSENGGLLLASGITPRIAVTPDSTRAVFLADPEADGSALLHSVALAGAATSLALGSTASNPPPRLRLTADSTRVVYSSAGDLRVAELDGSAPPSNLDGVLGTVTDEFYALHGERAVFQARTPGSQAEELYSVRLDGTGLVRLHPALPPFEAIGISGSSVGQRFQISADGASVAFVDDLLVTGQFELFASPIDGSGPARVRSNLQLASSDATGSHAPDFRFGPDGTLYFLADQEFEGVTELFAWRPGRAVQRRR